MIKTKGTNDRRILLDPDYIIYKCYLCNTTFRGFPVEYCLYCDIKQDMRTKRERPGYVETEIKKSEQDCRIW